jgi:hypothetical protein
MGEAEERDDVDVRCVRTADACEVAEDFAFQVVLLQGAGDDDGCG